MSSSEDPDPVLALPASKAAVEEGRPPQRLNAMSGRDLVDKKDKN